MMDYITGYNEEGEFVSLPKCGGMSRESIEELNSLYAGLGGGFRYTLLWWLYYYGPRWLYCALRRLWEANNAS